MEKSDLEKYAEATRLLHKVDTILETVSVADRVKLENNLYKVIHTVNREIKAIAYGLPGVS